MAYFHRPQDFEPATPAKKIKKNIKHIHNIIHQLGIITKNTSIRDRLVIPVDSQDGGVGGFPWPLQKL